MKRTSIALTTLFLLASPANAEGDPQAGQTKSVTCIACHGTDGNSMVPTFPKIAGQHAGYIEKQLAAFKLAASTGGKEGRNDPVMSGMAIPLSEQDMADLAAYFSTQTISAGTPVEGEAAEKAQKLYMGGDPERQITACVACHGAKGEGLNLAGYPAIANQHPAYLNASLKKFRSGDRMGDYNGMMHGVAKNLTDEDIDLLSNYIGGMQ